MADTMAKTNQVKIGNEHFKIWLKRLDPVARVEKMSAIAKTQAAAGLRGSLIKESLAQLSQRCHVMLIKLTDEDIKLYTRKPLVKRLQVEENKSKCKPIELDVQCKQSPNTTLNVNKTNELYESTSDGEKKYEKTPSLSMSQSTKKEERTDNNRLSSSLKRPKKISLKERYKELFGDSSEVDVVKIKVPKLHRTYKSVREQKVNKVLSTTVNVNIYNSPSNVEDEKTLVNRITHSDKIIDNSDDTCNNRLRIDVSLSKDGANFVEALSVNEKKRKAKTCSTSNRIKKTQRAQNQSNRQSLAGKSKIKPTKLDMPNLSAFHNVNSEDDNTVKELWKIFGMESPTDRSENIKLNRSHSQSLNLKTITNNESSTLNVISPKDQANEVPIKQNTPITPNSPSCDKTTMNKNVSKIIEKKIDDQENNSVDLDTEPLCKIAETFSLAILNTGSLNDDSVTFKSLDGQNSHKKKGSSICIKAQQFKNNESGSCQIETISLSDDDEEEDNLNNVPASKNDTNAISLKLNENQNKVGSIRVKSLGLLLNPQNVPETSRVPDIINGQIRNCNETNNENQEQKDKLAEEQFCENYRYYFDEVLDLKVLKLGELLHLAVSDEIRRKERIKRAEQLSSSDLIHEEIQRANKDFTEMMKVRGSEFAPLVDVIIKEFDQGSKGTLFLTLFVRIFERAKEIDFENGNHILAAKVVINTMLLKNLPTDEYKEISKVLLRTEDDFLKQVDKITGLLLAFRSKNSSQNNDKLSKDKVPQCGLPDNRTVLTQEKTQCVIETNSAFTTPVANIAAHSSFVRVIAPHAHSANLVGHGVEISGPVDVSLSNSIDVSTLNPIEHVGTSKQLHSTVQPHKTTSKVLKPQETNSVVTISSILNSSLSQPILTPIGNANMSNSTYQQLQNSNMNNSQKKTNPSPLTASITLRNINQMTLQSDPERNFTIPGPTHSVVNPLGMNLNNINVQQNERHCLMPNDVNLFPENSIGTKPNTLLPSAIPNQRPNLNANGRRSSSSTSNVVSPGVASPALHVEASTLKHSVHTNRSHSIVENHPNRNAVQRPPTSNFRLHNYANTTTSLPVLNNCTKKIATKEPNSETQIEAVKSSNTTNPNKGGSNGRTFVRYANKPGKRPIKNPTSNTNINYLQVQTTSNSNQYTLNTPTISMSKNIVTLTTNNGKTYQMNPGIIDLSSGTTERQFYRIPVSKQMGLSAPPASNSSDKQPHSRNFKENAQLPISTSDTQQYNSTAGSLRTPINNTIFRNNPGRSRPYGPQHPVEVVNISSTTTAFQEQNMLVSANSTIETQSSSNSRTENVHASHITLLNLLTKQSGNNCEQYGSFATVQNSNSPNSSVQKGSKSLDQHQLKVGNTLSRTELLNPHLVKPIIARGCTNLDPGSDPSIRRTSQPRSAMEVYCRNQAVQSSKGTTDVSGTPLMSSNVMPVKMGPTIYSEHVIEPALPVPRSTRNILPNQQEIVRSTSTSSMASHPVVASNVPSSHSEPSSSPTQPIPADLSQTTDASQQSLPMSSHCHPFIRRMPPSGKMKMFFGNK